jgi:pantothenate kinase-related protein Tda10
VVKLPLQLALLEPWKEKTFTVDSVGAINFLAGPNGSGKSRFAITLKQKLAAAPAISKARSYSEYARERNKSHP